MKSNIKKNISILIYYTDRSSVRGENVSWNRCFWKIITKSLKNKWMNSFFGYETVKNLQLYWLLLCLKIPKELFWPWGGVINGHLRFLPNNRRRKLGKNWSSFSLFSYGFFLFIHTKQLQLQFLTISLSWQIK